VLVVALPQEEQVVVHPEVQIIEEVPEVVSVAVVLVVVLVVVSAKEVAEKNFHHPLLKVCRLCVCVSSCIY
jgi:hypothetical protein